MIPTDTTNSTETWVCGACSSVNAGWRLRCERCGVIVRTSTSWGPPLPQQLHPDPPSSPKRRGGVTTALSIVGCLALGAVGVGAVGVGYYALQRADERRPIDERVESAPTTEADERFFAADSQFRAAFPVSPIRSTEPIDADGVAREMTFYVANVNLSVFLVATVELPPGSPFDMSTAAAGEHTSIEDATTTTWQGYDAVDAHMSDTDGTHFRMFVVRTPHRVYALTVMNEGDATAEYEAFKASFEITI